MLWILLWQCKNQLQENFSSVQRIGFPYGVELEIADFF